LSRSRNRFQRQHLEILAQRLFQMSLAQRIKRFQLRKDRADVILPATVVTLELMRIFEITEILVPNVGLKNGLFWESMERSRR
jgi:exopolyphosphatase / guanosine-5'-triphosphate,3'-diphosphate pyrophosphatase